MTDVEFTPLPDDAADACPSRRGDLTRLTDVTVELTVEVGRTRMSLGETHERSARARSSRWTAWPTSPSTCWSTAVRSPAARSWSSTSSSACASPRSTAPSARRPPRRPPFEPPSAARGDAPAGAARSGVAPASGASLARCAVRPRTIVHSHPQVRPAQADLRTGWSPLPTYRVPPVKPFRALTAASAAALLCVLMAPARPRGGARRQGPLRREDAAQPPVRRRDRARPRVRRAAAAAAWPARSSASRSSWPSSTA